MAWVLYLTGGALVVGEAPYLGAGLLSIFVGMLFHWKYWLAGIVGFFIGFNWGK